MLSIDEINLLQAQNEGLKKQNAELQRENAELKAENKRLKRENEIITGMCNSASNRFGKIYQTLQEIKKIAEKEIYMKQNSSMDRILDLITKAEEE